MCVCVKCFDISMPEDSAVDRSSREIINLNFPNLIKQNVIRDMSIAALPVCKLENKPFLLWMPSKCMHFNHLEMLNSYC